ncbi:MAG: Maf family protein [Gammaproteobacteria bacterium]
MREESLDAALIYLASQSPRRAKLLRQMGVRFKVVNAAVDESDQAGESPDQYVLRVARAKVEAALAVLSVTANRTVLAADTAVTLEGHTLGKPRDRADGLAMLARLSGRTHQVLSGLALWTPGGVRQALSTSKVTFRVITPEEAAAYWETGESADKAGAYAIQGRGAVFVERLEGSYSGVVGLPLFETAQLLGAAGITVFGLRQNREVRREEQ